MDNIAIVAEQVGVLFALMSVGAGCRLTKLLDDGAVKGIVNILMLVVTPCLVADCFNRPFDPERLKSLGAAFIPAFAVHVCLLLCAGACFRRDRENARPVLRFSAVFSNAGFMGIPLQHAVFGADGVFYGIVYVVVFNIFVWSWGYCSMRGVSVRARPGAVLKAVLVNPGTIGFAAGMAVFLSPTGLPRAVSVPAGLLAGLNTPLAMIAIGYYLAGAKPGPVVRLHSAYAAAFMRLVLAPAALIAALYPLRHVLDRTMMLATVTAASAPVAAMTTMFAAKYGRDVDLSVGLVSATTLLSIVTMPLAVAAAMSVL